MAAAPLNPAIAVPVDAVAKAPAALYAPNAVKAPDARPVPKPCAIPVAIT